MILLSRAEEIILLSIFKLRDDAYGVTIREQIKRDVGNYWSFGVIYKTLKKMTSKGFVKKVKSEPLAERGVRSKDFYEMTPKGIEALEEIQKVHASTWDGVVKLAYGKEK